jgi:hypothetical protein
MSVDYLVVPKTALRACFKDLLGRLHYSKLVAVVQLPSQDSLRNERFKYVHPIAPACPTDHDSRIGSQGLRCKRNEKNPSSQTPLSNLIRADVPASAKVPLLKTRGRSSPDSATVTRPRHGAHVSPAR